MGHKIWRRWHHGPRTAIFQNSGGGLGAGGCRIQGPGPAALPGLIVRSAPKVMILISRCLFNPPSPPTTRRVDNQTPHPGVKDSILRSLPHSSTFLLSRGKAEDP